MSDFQKIESKWQKIWEQKKAFATKSNNKKKFYVLEMFPYPSGSGLHMGHAFNYTIGDIYARFKRMQGFNVLYPMGYDSFGLPAENAAIKENIHPKDYTQKTIKNFIKQQKSLGLSYDWSRLISTSDPEYYKWNQYLFLQFYKKGLIYRKKATVNWCNKCNTVLANEQVTQGKCWRHNNEDVIEKQLEQWFIKTTKYSEDLLNGLKDLDWPNRIKLMQENWIGKSYGTLINFKLDKENLEVFTTRPDTLFGVTFLVYSIHHPKVKNLIKGTKQEKEVLKFLKNIPKQDKSEKDKEGVFLGRYATHPLTKEKIPVYASNFVVADYATGIVMGVPAHDQRDFEFAKKYKIPIKIVISPNKKIKKLEKAYTQEGILINSNEFNDLANEEAKNKITKYLISKKLAKKTINYKLRDWLVSRQRYWGTPIPFIYCKKCGVLPVQERDLPILLPNTITFGQGNPLETNEEFLHTTCYKCGSYARRETDTMDTFWDSSWYFLRYLNPKNKLKPFNKKDVSSWLPVKQYIGGAEHATMHLIYARFFTKALRDLKLVSIKEPFQRLFNQGILHKDGEMMSKSTGNVVLPEEVSKKYGIDTARLFLVSLASPDKDIEWSTEGIESTFKTTNKIFDLLNKKLAKKPAPELDHIMNKTIQNVTLTIESMKYNISTIELLNYIKYLSSKNEITKESLEILSKLISPFMPHIAEEIWSKLGNKKLVSLEKWPKANLSKINYEIDFLNELVDNTKKDISQVLKLIKINPKKIIISTAADWKYSTMKKVKKEKSVDISKVMKKVITKKNSKEISKLVPSLLKNPNKIPNLILTQEKEYQYLINNVDKFKDFNLEVEIRKNGPKAMPGKPGIFID